MADLFKKVSAIIFIFSVLISCDNDFNKNPNEELIIGNWQRTSENDTYQLKIENDNTFTESCDNNAMDPNYWHGNYSLNENKLIMEINEDFGGTTTTIEYTIEITENELKLITEEYTYTYTKSN
jgi:hypothetical protein